MSDRIGLGENVVIAINEEPPSEEEQCSKE